MTTGLKSLVQSGTRVWLDSVDPQAVKANKAQGVTGATSNPAIIAGLVNSGDFDADIQSLIKAGQKENKLDDEALTWAITDKLVGDAQKQFHDVWKKTECNDGWVSFELDPLLEDLDNKASVADRAAHLRRARQKVERRPRQPHDQGARHRSRPRRP